MLVFLITCFLSFILFLKSLALKPLSDRFHDMRLIVKSIKNALLGLISALFSSRMLLKKKGHFSRKLENVEIITPQVMCVLDLPDLVLESILEKLPPGGLCKMASLCNSLRVRCKSDHLWKKHMDEKWGGIIGPAAYREWQWHIASRKGSVYFEKKRGLMGYLIKLWPFSFVKSSFGIVSQKGYLAPVNSIMSWYIALESGKFWFPAQVYNRENGHVGFVLSCYDAEICYDRCADNFLARYPPHGRRASVLETGVTWDRVRSPLIDTSPYDLHNSDCLTDLKPGDHIEIQWRRSKEFPYGWWYGVVGHLETCDGNANYCRCHDNDTLMLEFNHYALGSRWRRTTVNRKDHREEGDEVDGFYGGIRKLCGTQEIATWRKMWPAQVLE